MAETAKKLIERRLARMRLGQAAFESVQLISDPEIRMAIVPLTEAEYEQAMEVAASALVGENMAGAAYRDRLEQVAVLARSIREVNDLTVKVFEDEERLMDALEPPDVNHIYEEYIMMTTSGSSDPESEGWGEDDLDSIKKVLQEISLNELSGRQWFALKRFLSTLSPTLLLDKLYGSSSINSSTQTTTEQESISNA